MECLKKLVLVMVFVAYVSEEAVAKEHTVGGSQGWDESVDFSSWASSQTFKVGDKLVFKYSTMHSVVELGNESAYKSCDIGSSVDSMNGGKSVVKLDKPGTRYFACGTMGHCDQGMKLKVKTVSSSDATSSDSDTTPSSSSSSSSSPSSTSTSATSDFLRPVAILSVFMVFALLFINV